MSAQHSAITNQLIMALAVILDADLVNWPDLIPSVLQLLSNNNHQVVNIALLVLMEIVKYYQYS